MFLLINPVKIVKAKGFEMPLKFIIKTADLLTEP